MTKYKLQTQRSLREQMKAVARGERRAPADAAKPSFNSVDAVVRLLTPENRELLAISATANRNRSRSSCR